MIISPSHRFVYVAIPRTASKSMDEWLMRHHGGIWYGGHHDYRPIPDGARSFLVFTTVRNPYDRAVSGYFGRHWGDRPRRVEDRVAVEPPTPAVMADLIERGRNEEEKFGSYRDFIEGAGVMLLLHYERLPECLLELPFADPATVREFPHVLERGVRPAGRFEDFFDDRYEAYVWDKYRDDFRVGGYQRHDSGLPEKSPSCKLLEKEEPSQKLQVPSGVTTTLWEIAEQSRPLDESQMRICRGLFAAQARTHPVAGARERFLRASRRERFDRHFVRDHAAFVMERAGNGGSG